MSSRKKSFKFEMIHLSKGDLITFVPLGIEVPISGPNTVFYNGRDWTLTSFVKEFIPKKKASGTYQGPMYFSYQGRVISDLRDEMDKFREEEDC